MLSSKALCAGILGSAFFVASVPAHAESSPSDPQYIAFQNNGAYTIDNVTVKWKDGDETKHKKYRDDLVSLKSFCADLSKVKSSQGDAIPLGAEVWLEVDIATGETKNCRKDNKHYFQMSGNTWKLKTKGSTHNNNHCQNASFPTHDLWYDSGNSKSC